MATKSIKFDPSTFIAKRSLDGQTRTLLEHSNGVKDLSLRLMKNYRFNDTFIEDQQLVIEYSALLHDLGKVTKSFQTKLLNIKKTETDIVTSEDLENIQNEATHAQLGAAFVYFHLKESKQLDLAKIKNIVSNIYWHHGMISWQHYKDDKGKNKYTLEYFYNSLTKEDKAIMYEMMCELIGSENVYKDPIFDDEEGRSPDYLPIFFDLKLRNVDLIQGRDEYNIVSRSILILSDRLYSKYEFSGLSIAKIATKYKNDTLIPQEVIKSRYKKYTQKRLTEQKDIAKNKGTLFVNAPTGNGKTMIGYLFANDKKKKTIWINPTNNVSRSVYDNLVTHISDMKTKHKVQLLLGGEIVAQNIDDDREADILITNIDNFLSPVSKNMNAMNLFSLFNSDKTLIFDEYHDFRAESAFFSLFCHIVRLRSDIMKGANTMLLSATHSGLIPVIFNERRFLHGKHFKCLPAINKHYKAAHTKKYKINLIDTPNTLDIDVPNNYILYTNTVRDIQDNYLAHNYPNTNNENSIIYHSYFKQDKKDEIYNRLVSTFGKEKEGTEKKEKVFASMVAQTSIDMSFPKMGDTVLSIESTFQRMGRLNRWGEYDSATLDMYNTETKSNDGIVSLIYSSDMREHWIEYVRQNLNGKEFTLDEFYEHYNKFYQYENVRDSNDKFIFTGDGNEGVMKTSIKYLQDVYPVRYDKSKLKEKKVYNANGNRIRVTGYKHYFFICPFDKTDESFSEQKYDFTNWIFNGELYGNNHNELFGHDGGYRPDFKNIGKYLMHHINHYSDFEFTDKHINDKQTDIAEFWFRNSKKSNTPHIRTDVVYNTKIGLRKLSWM